MLPSRAAVVTGCYRGLATFRGDARFSTWLYRIPTNTALMHRRAKARRSAESLEAYLPRFTEEGVPALAVPIESLSPLHAVRPPALLVSPF
jgi:DNA-directed RNA polymerase specialized sigma24 family protein